MASILGWRQHSSEVSSRSIKKAHGYDILQPKMGDAFEFHRTNMKNHFMLVLKISFVNPQPTDITVRQFFSTSYIRLPIFN